MATEPFLWGRAGRKLTPDQVEKERQTAALLAKGAMDFSPVQHWSQGLGRVAQGLLAGIDYRMADKAEADIASRNKALVSPILAALTGGSTATTPSSIPMTSAAGEVAATDPSGGPQSYRDAIASIESAGSGDYSAVGPTNPKLGRALGRYQIMEANIGPWSQEALGRAVTPDEFLANPQLQDAIFDAKFGNYVQQFGPEGAAQAWFAGPGGVGKVDRQDVLGTNVGEYGSRFLNALGPSGGAPASAAIDAAAPMGAPIEVGAAPPVSGVAEQPIEVDGGGDRVPMANQSINPAIIEALTDPQATPQTQMLARIVLEQQQRQAQAAEEQRLQAADPLRLLQLQRGQLELEQLRNPTPGFRTLSTEEKTTLGLPPQGAFQMSREGQISQIAGGDQGQFRRATPEEAQQFGAAAGQFGPDGKFYALNPPQGTSLSVDPNTGAVTFNQGAGVKPLTESQSKDTLYATRATNALPLVDRYESELLSLSGNLAEGIPLNLGNYAQSEQYQVARDAGRDFLATILRKDTGAAITANEEQTYGKMFLPQPGDKPAAIQAKRQRRALAVEAIKAGMPTSAIENMAKALDTVPKSTDIEIQTDIPGVKIRRKN
jgi:hypothetical protein